MAEMFKAIVWKCDDCGHAEGDHRDSGCVVVGCSCPRPPSYSADASSASGDAYNTLRMMKNGGKLGDCPIVPLGAWLVAERARKSIVSAGGVELDEDVLHVVSVGVDVKSPLLVPGARVVFGVAVDVQHRGKHYMMVRESEIVAVIDEGGAL